MDKFCDDNGFIGWFETSAKDDIGIEDAAKCLVAKILENDTGRGKTKEKGKANVEIGPQQQGPNPGEQKGGCC
jgi:Ras-related protein Rab-32